MSTGTGQNDAALKDLEAGIALFHEDRIAQAKAKFERVVAADGENRCIVRARDYLAVCERAETAAAERPDDPFLEAVMARNDGDLDRALELCGGDGHGEDDRFVYLAACVHALKEDAEGALDLLAKAVELEPKNRVHAFHDGDFAALEEDERFVKLVHDHSG